MVDLQGCRTGAPLVGSSEVLCLVGPNTYAGKIPPATARAAAFLRLGLRSLVEERPFAKAPLAQEESRIKTGRVSLPSLAMFLRAVTEASVS